ncbi:hypothetical protein RhiirA4_464766 [Rhizophagus irregularis]|uniref:Uncharacterized protein n=1 Tax=Rhizophagus irregularis TaxID=588596 RepID=A0A2I1GQQ8_9GLOM|nr:hypothetical protein RhiirA4_464766 [Rhizophagus irregularis]
MTLMELDTEGIPTTINITISTKKSQKKKHHKQKMKITKCMFGASLRTGKIDTYTARTERNGEDYIPKQQIGSGIENENSQSIKGVPFGCCPNTERVRIMQASLGKLCRDYGLDSSPWTQIPKKSCKLVLPDDIDGDSDDMSQVQMDSKDDEMLGVLNDPRNSLMLVEMIACESDICRVSSSIGFEIKIKVPLENLIVYIKRVKEYGFNHIIIIGELYCGMLFLDCYGRLFEWDHMQYLLFPLGDYLKKDFQINPVVAWKAAGEFVFEIKTREGQYLCKFDHFLS